MLYMTSNICRLLTCCWPKRVTRCAHPICVCSSGLIWLPCLPDQDLQAGLNSNPWQAVDVQMHKGYLAVQRAPGHPIIDPTASFGTSTPWHETVSRKWALNRERLIEVIGRYRKFGRQCPTTGINWALHRSPEPSTWLRKVGTPTAYPPVSSWPWIAGKYLEIPELNGGFDGKSSNYSSGIFQQAMFDH